MMKKEVKLVLRVYLEILKDFEANVVTDYCPDMDLSQLRNLLLTRGLRVVYIDFPSLLKVVDQSLSRGSVDLNDMRKVLGSMSGTTLPRIFNPIWERMYDEDGKLLCSADSNVILFARQLLGMFKKIVRDCSDEVTEQAMLDFITLDEQVGREFPARFTLWEDPLNDYPMSYNASEKKISDGKSLVDCTDRIVEKFDVSRFTADTISRVFWMLSKSFGIPRIDDLIPSHGTGSVSDMAWGDKYCFPEWSSRLESMFPMCDFAQLNYMTPPTEGFEDLDSPVKILPVPKTLKGPRIIGAESVSRMYCQQSLLWFLRKRITSSTFGSVDISSQERSQRLALAGSIDGSYATIDLSSASDRLSLPFVEELLCGNEQLLRLVAASRASTYQIGESVHKLQKFSHQGSAVTFPIQSIAYYSLSVCAVLEAKGLPFTRSNVRKVSKQISVYGDDIIVPGDAYTRTIDLLTKFGMMVNVTKSHGDGFFREACGIDAYKGVDISITYIRDLCYDIRKPETVIRFVEVGNNLHKAGFWNASCGLFSTQGILIPVTSDEQVPLSCYTFVDGFQLPSRMRTRYNWSLQIDEMYSLLPKTSGKKQGRDGYQSILQFSLEQPDPESKWTSGFYKERPKAAISSNWIKQPV